MLLSLLKFAFSLFCFSLSLSLSLSHTQTHTFNHSLTYALSCISSYCHHPPIMYMFTQSMTFLFFVFGLAFADRNAPPLLNQSFNPSLRPSIDYESVSAIQGHEQSSQHLPNGVHPTLNYVSSPLCATCFNGGPPPMSDNRLTLSCIEPNDVIVDVLFASYGTPDTSSCPSFHVGACSAANATAIVRAACVGHHSCTIFPNTTTFGDPCFGIPKYLAVVLACKSSAGSGVCSSGPPPPPPYRAVVQASFFQGSSDFSIASHKLHSAVDQTKPKYCAHIPACMHENFFPDSSLPYSR